MDNHQNQVFEEQAPEVQPIPVSDPPVGKAVKTMVFGILSINLGVAPFFSILGIIFGALAKKWSLPIIDNYPYTGARLFAKAGRITGKIGFILGIVFTVFWIFYFVLIAALIVLGVTGY